MKVVMQEEGRISYNGYDKVIYKKGDDVSNIPKHAKDYFLKVKKAKEIVEKAKAEKIAKKEEVKKEEKKDIPKKVTAKEKAVKVEENKMVKDIENK